MCCVGTDSYCLRYFIGLINTFCLFVLFLRNCKHCYIIECILQPTMSSFASLLIVSLFIIFHPGHGSEYCAGYTKICSNYCCGSSSYPDSQYCCSSCSSSVNNQSDCYTVNVGAIIGGIAASIAFSLILSFIICLCCGCICSSRTGIQRRGRIIRSAGTNVVVINATDQIPYPQTPGIYIQDPLPYPAGEQGIANLPTVNPPPYPAYPTYQSHGNPPPYNKAFERDPR